MNSDVVTIVRSVNGNGPDMMRDLNFKGGQGWIDRWLGERYDRKTIEGGCCHV